MLPADPGQLPDDDPSWGSHPMGRPLVLPGAGGPWAVFIDERCTDALRTAREQLAALVDGGPAHPRVLAQWNELTTALGSASALTSLMSQVHPDAAVRSVAEARQREVSTLSTELRRNRSLFDALAGVERDGLDAEADRLLQLSLRDSAAPVSIATSRPVPGCSSWPTGRPNWIRSSPGRARRCALDPGCSRATRRAARRLHRGPSAGRRRPGHDHHRLSRRHPVS